LSKNPATIFQKWFDGLKAQALTPPSGSAQAVDGGPGCMAARPNIFLSRITPAPIRILFSKQIPGASINKRVTRWQTKGFQRVKQFAQHFRIMSQASSLNICFQKSALGT
jgi:hypothetical protein